MTYEEETYVLDTLNEKGRITIPTFLYQTICIY